MATVNRATYNSMKAQAEKARAERSQVDRQVQELQQRIAELKTQSTGLSPREAREIERKINSAIHELQGEIDALRIELGTSLGKQAVETRRMLNHLQSLANANKEELGMVQSSVSSLEKHIEKENRHRLEGLNTKRKQALACSDQLSNLVHAISALFPEKYETLYPERLQPGYFTLQSSLGTVLDDIQQGYYEAAIGLAQTSIAEAAGELGYLQYLDQEFLNAEKVIGEYVDRILKTLHAMGENTDRILSIDKSEYTDSHSDAWWSRELYEEVQGNFRQYQAQIQDLVEIRDAEGLRMVLPSIQGIERQLQTCVEIANQERRLHYQSCETISRIYEILSENEPHSWSIVELRQDDEDLREPIVLTLQHEAGYQAVIACTPLRTRPQELSDAVRSSGGLQLHIDIFDQGNQKDDISRCRIYLTNISDVLRRKGIVLEHNTKNEDLVAETTGSFIEKTVQDDRRIRNKWILNTREMIGL